MSRGLTNYRKVNKQINDYLRRINVASSLDIGSSLQIGDHYYRSRNSPYNAEILVAPPIVVQLFIDSMRIFNYYVLSPRVYRGYIIFEKYYGSLPPNAAMRRTRDCQRWNRVQLRILQN